MRIPYSLQYSQLIDLEKSMPEEAMVSFEKFVQIGKFGRI